MSLMNRTEPSPMPTFTPPGWLLVAVMAAATPPLFGSEKNVAEVKPPDGAAQPP